MKAGNMLDLTYSNNAKGKYSVAAAASDNSAVTSAAIDRSNYGSCKVIIPWSATLQEDKTFSLTIAVKDCATSDGSYADYSTVAKTVYATGGSGGSTSYGTATLDVNLNGAKRYIETVITSDLSATGTDTAFWAANVEMMDPVVAPV